MALGGTGRWRWVWEALTRKMQTRSKSERAMRHIFFGEDMTTRDCCFVIYVWDIACMLQEDEDHITARDRVEQLPVLLLTNETQIH